MLDFDDRDVGDRWLTMMSDRHEVLLARLVRVRSPRPGLHVYYRCDAVAKSGKIASIPAHGGRKPKAIVETKGA